MLTFLMSMDIQRNNLGDLLLMLGGLSKLRSILGQYDSNIICLTNLRKCHEILVDWNGKLRPSHQYAQQEHIRGIMSHLGSGDRVEILAQITT
ncbi:hypothetical protein CR513_02448, partial [Mucuna pruriens]